MAVDDDPPSERSPLISKSVSSPAEATEGLSPSAPISGAQGDTTEGIRSENENAKGHTSYGTNGNPVEASEESDALERQHSADKPSTYEGRPEIRKRLPIIMPAIAIGVFLSAADQTIIVSSYGKIGSELHALNMTSWIATAYFLTLTSFQPLYGKLSDIFGRKACLLFAYLIFGLGCLFCGLSPDINTLIASRAFAGIGGGGMTTVVSILLSDAVPLRERGTWQGYINIIFASGASTGAPLGGILADKIGWRWAFLFQAPLCLVAFIAVAIVLKEPEKDSSHWREKLKRIDFLGAAILIAAVFALLLALDRGSNVSWRATVTLVSLGLSVPLFALFALVEIRVAAEPFAPGHVVFHRSLFACYLCNFFSFAGYLAAIFYIPLYFQAVDDMTATQAGVRLIPGVICGVSGSLFAGFYMQRFGKYYWLTVLCYTFLTIGLTVILLFSGVVRSSVLGIILGMCVCGFSNGIGVTSTLIGLIANASREDQAIATACSYLFRSLGSVFGVSISATVANSSLRNALMERLSGREDPAEIARRVRQSLEYLRELEPDVRRIVADCYGVSVRAAFGLEIGLVAGAALSAWFIREKALSR